VVIDRIRDVHTGHAPEKEASSIIRVKLAVSVPSLYQMAMSPAIYPAARSRINLGDLPPSMYFLKYTDERTVEIRKIIKK